MEQAKKRDHKVVITDIAIEKVPFVKVPGLTDDLCAAIRDEHREILRIARDENDSNEVLSVWLPSQARKAYVNGDEHQVTPAISPEAHSIFVASGQYELFYLHNHPSTSRFSMADIMEFARFAQIGFMSVVTNQGNVHILRKNATYSFHTISQLISRLSRLIGLDEINEQEAATKFLKLCGKGGVDYVR